MYLSSTLVLTLLALSAQSAAVPPHILDIYETNVDAERIDVVTNAALNDLSSAFDLFKLEFGDDDDMFDSDDDSTIGPTEAEPVYIDQNEFLTGEGLTLGGDDVHLISPTSSGNRTPQQEVNLSPLLRSARSLYESSKCTKEFGESILKAGERSSHDLSPIQTRIPLLKNIIEESLSIAVSLNIAEEDYIANRISLNDVEEVLHAVDAKINDLHDKVKMDLPFFNGMVKVHAMPMNLADCMRSRRPLIRSHTV